MKLARQFLTGGFFALTLVMSSLAFASSSSNDFGREDPRGRADPRGRIDIRMGNPNNVDRLVRAVDDLEQRLQGLQNQLMQQEYRIQYLEAQIARPLPVPVIRSFVCTTTDNFGSTYLGRGNSQLEAEANVKQACARARNPMFCDNPIRCEIENQ